MTPRCPAPADVPDDPRWSPARGNRPANGLTDRHLGEDVAFVTELVVSEPVTDATRYGVPPIQPRTHPRHRAHLRGFRRRHTAPHMRRARTFDEGGRGLLLVARLTERWGSRQTRVGKTIRAEAPLTRETGTV
ncbi:ATP-binding protein [Streptomyces sp. B21-101]|uniref:ATP-binding protein n=1 Tax=Streptomyces sp. B21-101 TaxID=3039415 RepID=UPI002FF0D974